MVKNWSKLGFIVNKTLPSPRELPVYVEVERQQIHPPPSDIIARSRSEDRSHGGFSLPQNDPIESLEELKEHLSAAIGIEMLTIPVYLYGLYSVVAPPPIANAPKQSNAVMNAVRG